MARTIGAVAWTTVLGGFVAATAIGLVAEGPEDQASPSSAATISTVAPLQRTHPPETAVPSAPPPTTRSMPSTTVDPCRAPDVGTRPESGTELRAADESGWSWLEVTNGTNSDAVVKIVTLDAVPHAIRAVFLRASDTVTISDVPNREFRVAFSLGSHWDEARSTFSCNRRASVFEESFDFTSSTWTLGLHPVPGGNAPTDKVNPDTFEAY